VLFEDPSELEKQIGVVRQQVTGLYNDGYTRTQGVVNRWIGVEQAVESK
jgi:organizing structure protein 2